MAKTIGIIFIVIVALTLLYLGWKYFIKSPDDQSVVIDETTNNTNIDPSAPFNPGDDVYVVPLRASYMYIYSYPNNNSENEIGRTTNALSGANSIGKYVSMAGNGRYVKVKLNGIIERKRVNPGRPGSYIYHNERVIGDYFVPADKVQNKPY